MSYEEKLAFRVSESLEGIKGITKKKMFGGLCFLLNGNMLYGIAKGKLVARIGPETYESSLKQKYARPMDFTGKPLRGMVYVLPDGIKTKSSLKKWMDKSLDFAKRRFLH